MADELMREFLEEFGLVRLFERLFICGRKF